MTKAYGSYNNIAVDNTRNDGKLKGRDISTLRQPVTDDLWEEHLKGKNGIGIIPIREDNSACFGAIDIDVYDGLDPVQIAIKLDTLKLPLIPCRSKSGGVHVYLFARVPVAAAKMVERLRDIAVKLGYGRAEIFPVQTHLARDGQDLGAWINVPYFAWQTTDRYAIKADGTKLSAEEFLAYAEECKVDADFFPDPENPNGARKPRKQVSEGEKLLPDGPPCLQHLVEIGIPEGGRNKVLHNLGIYYRKSQPDFVTHIESANAKYIHPPLPATEVKDICGSLAKKQYSYGCELPELSPYCNAAKCRLRKYGIGGMGSGSGVPKILGFRKLLTDPPIYFLDMEHPVNQETRTVELILEELVDPRLFKLKCGKYMGILPIMPANITWQQICAELVANATNMDPLPSEAVGVEGQFWELLEEFCTDNSKATTRAEILLGMTFDEDGRTYFRTRDLENFLNRKHFKEFKRHQLTKVLQKHRLLNHVVWRVPDCVNLWSLPSFEKRHDPFAVPESVNKNERPF